MSAEVIQFRRPSKALVPVQRSADDMIAVAGDEWLAVRLAEFSNAMVEVLRRTELPLLPDQRRKLMRAVAVVCDQPEF